MRNDRERSSGSDEVDLVELARGVGRQKLWVAVIAAPIIALGLVYVMLAPPVYEAKLFVQPPSQSDISQLNLGRGAGSGLPSYNVKDVYEGYLSALQSEAVRAKFFRSVYLPTLTERERKESRDTLYGDFNRLLKVSQAVKDITDRYVITAYVEDPRQAVDWVVKYSKMATDQAKGEILKGGQIEISMLGDNLEQQIRAARASARNQREDQIAQLTEALRIARSIGLEMPPIISDNLSTEVSAGMGGSLAYMRGSKALEAEIANLESRSSDDPFIKDLRERQEQLSFLRNLKVDPSLVAMYQQDGAVEQPDEPAKPRRALIMLLVSLIGLGGGVGVALGRDVWLRRNPSLAGN